MKRLSTLAPRIKTIDQRCIAVATVAERRVTGRALQSRRYAIWLRDPRCAVCGKGVLYPHGFELDHKVRLADGGGDTDDNCQVLCVHYELVGGQRVKAGCHAAKSAGEQC